ncbi:MBL fold metallo-hydrolase [bacterium]|nr:MBL fold metallo-hydrolase [bacterium]
MKIHFLGTSSASVTADRDNTSLLVEAGADLFLFDCGGNPAGKILKLGYDPRDLDAVFLTHLHIDHCYGLPTLLFHLFLDKRSRPLQLFCPEEEFDLMNKQLLAHGITDNVRCYTLDKKPIAPVQGNTIWETDHAKIVTGNSNHSRPTRAFRLVENRTGRSMLFTGDTTPLEETAKLAADVDVLVHEATYLESHKTLALDYRHSTARQAGEIATKANAKALAMVHFEIPPGGSVNHYRAEAALVYQGTIYTPDDMTSISI